MDESLLHSRIFKWWKKYGRVLPWREKDPRKPFHTFFAPHLFRDPYNVVVSEVMLQQTQVDRVLPKYQAWMTRWPKIKDLAKSPLSEVLIFWQGLGYNRRARFLWLLAKEIAESRKGVWPTAEPELLALPGVGKYTARAIQVFAQGMQLGVVDTNIKRILNRWYATDLSKPPKTSNDKLYFDLADKILPLNKADPWHQSLMDFGSLICTAKKPDCPNCPAADLCQANQNAIKLGFQNYADQLAQQPKTISTKKSIQFKDTDRYFRGRIIDRLRLGKSSVADLQKYLNEECGLNDMDRFSRLLQSLAKENLIKSTNYQVELA